MYLAFDTETTDLPRPHLDLTHPAQPHLLQFAGIVFDDEGNELERMFTLVKPGTGAHLSGKAFETHGISLEQAFHLGMEPRSLLTWFQTRARQATAIVGHNVNFDVQIMSILCARQTGQAWKPSRPVFCTMTHATPILNLPATAKMRAAGRFHPKSPSLSECIDHFFGERLPGAHDAVTDVRACIRVYRYLTRANIPA